MNIPYMGFDTGYLGQTVNELNYELESHYNFLYSIKRPLRYCYFVDILYVT